MVFVAAACGSDDEGGVTEAAAVEGTTWKLDELAGERVPDGVEVTLRFDGASVEGNGGCNQYSGAATFADGAVAIGPELMSTLMACEGPAGEIEGEYLEALPMTTAFVVQDDRLVLSVEGDEPVLSFSATG